MLCVAMTLGFVVSDFAVEIHLPRSFDSSKLRYMPRLPVSFVYCKLSKVRHWAVVDLRLNTVRQFLLQLQERLYEAVELPLLSRKPLIARYQRGGLCLPSRTLQSTDLSTVACGVMNQPRGGL